MKLVKKWVEKKSKAEAREHFTNAITELEKEYYEIKELLTHSDEYISQAKYNDVSNNHFGFLGWEWTYETNGKELVEILRCQLIKREEAIKKARERLEFLETFEG